MISRIPDEHSQPEGRSQSHSIPVRAVARLTGRQAEVLQLASCGLSCKQIAHNLGISVRTVEDHFSAMRQRAGTHSQSELIACATVAGLVTPTFPVPESAVSGTIATGGGPGQPVPRTSPRTAGRTAGTETVSGTIGIVTTAPAPDNSVRIGYARVSTRAQDHQTQLDALAAAHCREIITETAGRHSSSSVSPPSASRARASRSQPSSSGWRTRVVHRWPTLAR